MLSHWVWELFLVHFWLLKLLWLPAELIGSPGKWQLVVLVGIIHTARGNRGSRKWLRENSRKIQFNIYWVTQCKAVYNIKSKLRDKSYKMSEHTQAHCRDEGISSDALSHLPKHSLSKIYKAGSGEKQHSQYLWPSHALWATDWSAMSFLLFK